MWLCWVYGALCMAQKRMSPLIEKCCKMYPCRSRNLRWKCSEHSPTLLIIQVGTQPTFFLDHNKYSFNISFFSSPHPSLSSSSSSLPPDYSSCCCSSLPPPDFIAVVVAYSHYFLMALLPILTIEVLPNHQGHQSSMYISSLSCQWLILMHPGLPFGGWYLVAHCLE